MERLHLPLISSPSLFHRPSTPRHSSTQFEWSIDEVSSLNPANVEAHETQFMSIIDPEEEAQAQAAISSYFKEQLIVPSPIDCPLRNQKIILPPRRHESIRPPKRDAICQTELTLPPILPKELADLLLPYMTFTMDQQQSSAKINCDIDETERDARDASLRRKLFETSLNTTSSSGGNDIQLALNCLSPPPKSPETGTVFEFSARNYGSPTGSNASLSSICDQASSFGSLSPISKTITTPTRPIQQNHSSLSASSIYRSTPERIAYRTSSSNSLINMSMDCSVIGPRSPAPLKRKSLSASFCNMKNGQASSFTAELNDYDDDVNDGAIIMSDSALDGSGNSETPTSRNKNRVANRKNLSRSFSSCLNSEETRDYIMDEDESIEVSPKRFQMSYEEPTAITTPAKVDGLLTKTDSGFNEMDQ